MKPIMIKILFTALILIGFTASLACAELIVNDFNDGAYVPSSNDLIVVI